MCRQLILIIVTFNDFLFLFNRLNLLDFLFSLDILYDFCLDSVLESTLLSLSSLSLHNFLVFFGEQILVLLFKVHSDFVVDKGDHHAVVKLNQV